jgi:hypothetical protein
MALPATGSISLGDIQTELGFSSANLAQFYDSSDLLGGGALMWHNVYGAVGTYNYGIGTSGMFSAIDIYNAYTASSNLTTSLWYNYHQIPEIVFTVDIAHAGSPGDPDIQLELIINDENGNPMYTIFAGTINPQSSVSYPLTVTNSVFVSSSYGGYTFVIQNLTALGSPNSVNCSVSAYDSDGAGPGQNRDAYNPPINPFDIFTSPQTFTCCEDATLSGKLIAINKRTTIEIVFSP